MDDNSRGPDEFDWAAFGRKVRWFLDRRKLTHRAAAKRYGGSASCWHRSRAGIRVSVGNCLFLCRVIGLDPFDFMPPHPKARGDVSRKTQTETRMLSGV